MARSGSLPAGPIGSGLLQDATDLESTGEISRIAQTFNPSNPAKPSWFPMIDPGTAESELPLH